MRRFHRKLVTATVVTMFATLSLASAAGAVSNTPTALGVPVVDLTAAEQAALQAEVGEHLNDYGAGTQIGINQIAYRDGLLILTLPLPGETKARAIGEPIAPQGVANCAFTHACLWSDTNFNGSRLDRVNCDFIALGAPFNSSTGSIHNNQTSGTQTVIFNASRQILNANLAPSRINDTGVGTRSFVRFWRVC